MNHEKDIEQELGRLPNTLKESYRAIHDRIKASGPTSRSTADRAIAWLLCATDSLDSHDFLSAVSVDSEGSRYEISHRDLLNSMHPLKLPHFIVCCSLNISALASPHKAAISEVTSCHFA